MGFGDDGAEAPRISAAFRPCRSGDAPAGRAIATASPLQTGQSASKPTPSPPPPPFAFIKGAVAE